MCSSPAAAPADTTMGPVSNAASKASAHLAPLATSLRASLPATAPALDAAASTLSRGTASADAHLASLRTELSTPEAVELRGAAAKFVAAVSALALVYLARGVALVEGRLGLAPAAPEVTVLGRVRRAVEACGARGVQKVLGEMQKRVQGKGGGRAAVKGVVGMVGVAAGKATQYRGQGACYVVGVAGWLAEACEMVVGERAVGERAENMPVGESFGTLPFSPVMSEGSDLSGMAKEGKAE